MKKALIVGINDYPNDKLTACINDATRLSTLLERDGNGDPNFEVHQLLSNRSTITRASLKKEIISLFEGSPDVALFYYSGHGHVNTRGGYLVTPDATQYDEGINMNEILSLVNQSIAKNRIVILDCCYAGNMGTPSNSGSNCAEIADGVTILASSNGDETSSEIENQHGVFTSLLIDALQGSCADLLGHITTGSIYAYVDRALGPWEQRPLFKTNVSELVSLRDVPSPIDKKILRNLCLYFESPYDEFQLNPSFEDTERKHNKDNCLVFKELQKLTSEGLVKPVGEEYMYFAAMNSKSCKLTAMGIQYWKLVKSGRV